MKTDIEHLLPVNHEIYFLGDQHLGTRTCHIDIIKAQVDEILAGKNRYAVLMGDLADAIEARDPRFNVSEHAGDGTLVPTEQYALAKKLYEPIADRILVAIEGNHDYKMNLHGTGSLMKAIFNDPLDIPYGDYSSVVRIKMRNGLSYKMYLWHGAGMVTSNAKDPEQRAANIKAGIQRKLAPQMSDCHVMAMGHIHRLFAFRPPPETSLYTTPDGSLKQERGHKDQPMDIAEMQDMVHIPANLRWYTVSGTAKRSRLPGHVTWEERMGFSGSDLGWSKLTCREGRYVSMETCFWSE